MNEKSNLQIRAERAAEQFADKARKPLVVEFAGVPKAGKTTTPAPVENRMAEGAFSSTLVCCNLLIMPSETTNLNIGE